ncbi:hypothetical protein DENSPDRAFT_789777 [Dentipellis sp. KUC8613]|nr:hypothetical protein DENSPDRAFT_789777 [Dentipellis sp. KUC8613]
MSHHFDALWPEQTPAPSPPPNIKRKRRWNSADQLDHRAHFGRQVVANQSGVSDAEQQCQFSSGNNVISCFPTADTVIAQHQWATFVWNTNRPEITQTNLVNIYLFHGDSGQQILQILNHNNPRGLVGSVTAQVNDSWFPDSGLGWSGHNISYPYYWVITRADKGLDGDQIPQSTFSAVQTTVADVVTSSRASVSSIVAASSSSVAVSLSSISALSSRSAASVSHASVTANPTGTANPSATPTGNLQSDSGSNFPHWAIAVIVVLGFLAIVASCILVFLIVRRIRRNRELSRRNSMGSASPMMANVHTNQPPQSPTTDQTHMRSSFARVPSINSPDGASTISHTHSAGDAAPFSGADAAIMANAFRQALRKPDFAAPPIDEGESPDSHQRRDAELLSRELAEEGRDIRSVSSSRGVRVETLSDGDGEGTIQDHPH